MLIELKVLKLLLKEMFLMSKAIFKDILKLYKHWRMKIKI